MLVRIAVAVPKYDSDTPTEESKVQALLMMMHTAIARPKHDSTLKELQKVLIGGKKGFGGLLVDPELPAESPEHAKRSTSPVKASPTPSARPVAAALMAVLEQSHNHVLLKRAFQVFAAKNQFTQKESRHEAGFENLARGLLHLDAGELMSFLKNFRIVPRWIATDEVMNIFSKSRYHEPVAARPDASWEELEKSTGLLNFREFTDLLVRLALAIRYATGHCVRGQCVAC